MFVMKTNYAVLFVRGSQMHNGSRNEAAQSWSQDPDFSGWLENIGNNQNPAVWQNPRTQARYTTEVQTLKIAEETATLLVLTPEVPSFFTMLENLGDALACGFVIYQLADNASPPLYVNAAYRQIFGKPAADFKAAMEAVHPQDRPALQSALAQLEIRARHIAAQLPVVGYGAESMSLNSD